MLSTGCFFHDRGAPGIYTLSYTTLFRSKRFEPVHRHGRAPCLQFVRRFTLRCLLFRSLAAAAAAATLRRLRGAGKRLDGATRSEDHTSELQSLAYIVCRLPLEKKQASHT